MRYLPLSEDDRARMLAAIGAESIDELFRDVPESARLDGLLELPPHMGEQEVERVFAGWAAKNLSPARAPCFLGAGAYRHHLPAAVDYLIQRGEFLTAYTPYQPEVSQGTLQALFEFQTQVSLLTDMEAANASMYDGATATAEAALMAARITKRPGVVLSGGLHPHYRQVTATMAGIHGLAVNEAEPDWRGTEDLASLIDGNCACVVVQNPGFFGRLADQSALAGACHEAGALLIYVVTEIVSLGAVKPPGRMGADIVAAEGQSLGNAMSFGGPTVGLLAVRNEHLRQMPGRIVGETVDADGKRGFVLTLSVREQHIRREKATSNICTNSGLCALAFTIHMSLLGETGLRQLAMLNHQRAVELKAALAGVSGVSVLGEVFFNEITLKLPQPAAPVVETLAGQGIIAGVPASRLYPGDPALENLLVLAATEMTSEADIAALAAALGEALA